MLRVAVAVVADAVYVDAACCCCCVIADGVYADAVCAVAADAGAV